MFAKGFALVSEALSGPRRTGGQRAAVAGHEDGSTGRPTEGEPGAARVV